jgi:hypothetical protein
LLIFSIDFQANPMLGDHPIMGQEVQIMFARISHCQHFITWCALQQYLCMSFGNVVSGGRKLYELMFEAFCDCE